MTASDVILTVALVVMSLLALPVRLVVLTKEVLCERYR